MEDLNDDIRFLLHDQLALIGNIEHYLESVTDVLFNGEDTPNDVDGKYVYIRLKKKIEQLTKSNESFIKFLNDKKFDSIELQPILIFNESIIKYMESSVEINPSFLYDKTIRLEKFIRAFRKEPIANENFKTILKEIYYIKNILSLYFLYQAKKIISHIKIKSSDFLKLLQSENNVEDYLPFELTELLEQVIRIFQLKSESKKIVVKRKFDKDKYYVIGSRPNILSAFENVFHNAIKYNRTLKNHEVWVDIKIQEESEFVSVEIENWGVGILQHEIDENLVFKIGYKGEYSRMNNIEGSGIGLSFAKREIEKSGGFIHIDSKPTKKDIPITESSNFITVVSIKLKKA